MKVLFTSKPLLAHIAHQLSITHIVPSRPPGFEQASDEDMGPGCVRNWEPRRESGSSVRGKMLEQEAHLKATFDSQEQHTDVVL